VSRVLGIDLSSFNVDLVTLDEDSDAAGWTRVALGTDKDSALDRLRRVAEAMPPASFYEDIYLAAVESPYGTRLERGTQAKLNRVFGAVCACLPARVHLWEVMPGDWRKALGLKGNASKEECAEAVRALWLAVPGSAGDVPQDALDAYAVAYYAREHNHRGVTETLAARELELF
jgi:Holliday junction resolvasome RuvABC endonuclease subunit